MDRLGRVLSPWLLLAVILPLCTGCASMMRELNANEMWEDCQNTACTVCSGTGLADCTACNPQGESQCTPCNGSGMADKASKMPCGQCQSQGYVLTTTGMQVQCGNCGGAKQVTVYQKSQCGTCGGRGWGACPDCEGDKQKVHGRMVKVYQDGQRVPRPMQMKP